MAMEVIDPKRESIDVILLNGHVIRLPSKYFCICPPIDIEVTLGQRSNLLYWVVVNEETHNCSKC